MTIEKAIHLLLEEYKKAKKNDYILKPISFALYNVWKYFDSREKSRKVEI